jgi:hypothetical protein
MTKNVHKKLFPFLLSIIFSFALNAQQIDSSKKKDIIANIDTSKKWATVSFGLNVGLAFNRSTSTGWFSGDYSTLTTPSIALTLRLNLNKKWSIGSGFSRYNMQSTSTKILTATIEAPSTIASEPNYLLDYKGRIRIFCNVYEIPFEISYKFNKMKNCHIPIISVGTTYTHYYYPSQQDFPYDYISVERRASGSKPVEDKVLRPYPNPDRFSFTDKIRFSPFVTIGIIRAFSEHSFLKLNAKCALYQNTTISTLRSNSEDVTRSSDFKTLQLGLNAEYFITF